MRVVQAAAVLIHAASLMFPSCDAQQMPAWTGPDLDPLEPLGGATLAANVIYAKIVQATPSIGTYNTYPMIDFHSNRFLVSWLTSNGTNGSLGISIMYSQSTDGSNWTKTDGTNILFPSLGPIANVSLVAAPALHINGSVYAAASTYQFFTYPDQRLQQLLLRRVYTTGIGQFGPLFWATDHIPAGMENATKTYGILKVDQTDAQTQADIAMLQNQAMLPCDPTSSGSWKCPACLNGCPTWQVPSMGQSTTYHVSPGGPDVVLYRAAKNMFQLPASFRSSPAGVWSQVTTTDIPDTGSSFDTGNLPDGRPYLLSNAMPNILRDPLFLSTSGDGWNFNATNALTSCTLPVYESPEQPSGCFPRYNPTAKELGCQYPQSAVLTAPGFEGFWAVYSVNNEDIWVLHAPFESIV